MEINRDGLKRYMDEYGVVDTLKGVAELLDKRVYFSVDGFNICRKELNLALPAVAFSKDDELMLDTIHSCISPIERQHIDKIDRMSNLTVEKLAEKLEKLLIKDSLEHTMRYAKELLYKDENRFYTVLGKFALLDSIKSRKALLISAFRKIGRKDDELIFLLISYMVKARADYSDIEKIKNGLSNLSYDELMLDLKNRLNESKEKVQCKLGLDIISYLNLIVETVEIDASNKEEYKIFIQILLNNLNLLNEKRDEIIEKSSEIEKEILQTLISNLKI